jgi:hypothetical protein
MLMIAVKSQRESNDYRNRLLILRVVDQKIILSMAFGSLQQHSEPSPTYTFYFNSPFFRIKGVHEYKFPGAMALRVPLTF